MMSICASGFPRYAAIARRAAAMRARWRSAGPRLVLLPPPTRVALARARVQACWGGGGGGGGGGSGGDVGASTAARRSSKHARHLPTPTPNPSPQGGGELSVGALLA